MSDALQALYEGDTERAQQLLAPDDRLSVFEAAAFGRTERLAAILSEDPSQVAARSEDGFTALHTAAQSGDVELVKLLLEHGADPGLRASDGRRAVDQAQTDELRALLTR